MIAILQTLALIFAIWIIVLVLLSVYALGQYRAEQAMPRREAESFDAHAETAVRLNTGRCHCDICVAARAAS